MFQLYIDKDVSLRIFIDKDAEEFYQLTMDSKNYLREWLGWVDFTQKVEDTAAFIAGTHKGVAETGGHPKSAAIIYRGAIAGTIGFNEINKSHKFGIVGYWLGEGFQGKGIMTKACRAFVDYGFQTMGLNRIEIRAAEGNMKSRAIPERLGFTEEGKIRQAEWLYDHYVDHIVYGMLSDEWNK
ncbi:GNAT family N-acetyltransferase [Peribacillus deserti]|uniref:GNAT family N-acetyltransferase n=1 Tax=Peribacillus deserti TaxID=673318 RepID=A0A2N5M3I0_9BACI|nr:GNAT family protein [Peribacillus deserti]PLT28833.1 GNAT family N-acetyltransferase [Peribacillus deserti]